MANEYFMETFDNENAVLSRMKELKNQGAAEDDLYIVAQEKEQLSMVRGRTDVEYKVEDENLKDKFMAFLSGDNPVQKALRDMGINEQEVDRYVQEVKNGKILLFSDEIQGTSAKGRGLNANAAYGDPLENENSPFPPEHLKSSDKELANDRNNVRDSVDFTADEAITTQNTASPDRSDVTPADINVSSKDPQPRVVGTDHNDLEEMGSVKGGIPAADPNMTDIPPAGQGDNDVPPADRSKNRLSDTESPEEWPQAASDRIQSNEKNK